MGTNGLHPRHGNRRAALLSAIVLAIIVSCTGEDPRSGAARPEAPAVRVVAARPLPAPAPAPAPVARAPVPPPPVIRPVAGPARTSPPPPPIDVDAAPVAAVREVLINEIHYHPASESRGEQFVELANRGGEAVSLGGWRLVSREVRFTFPADASIAAGGHLAVAADAAWLRGSSLVPETARELVLGDWSGSLGLKGDRVTLLNAAGERVESVTYSASSPYPARAAGLGSSLERRSPSVDGGFAGNWGASRAEAARSGWRRVRTSGIATSNRLYVYLLGEGTIHVDDLSISAGPTRAEALEETQPLWRFTGTHMRSGFESDRPGADGTSLRVHASAAGGSSGASAMASIPLSPGSTWTLECSLLVEDPAVPVVLRLSGSQRGHGLYVEVQGERPTAATPAARNSIATDALPPFISSVSLTPATLSPRDRLSIEATVHSHAPLDSVMALYQAERDGAEEGPLQSRALELVEGSETPSGGGVPPARRYRLSIGPFRSRTLVTCRVEAGESRYPTADARRIGAWVRDPSIRSRLPVYHIFISPSSLATLNRNVYTDVYEPATVILDGQAFCDVGFRYRGQTSRRYPKKQLKVRLNPGEKYRPFPGHPGVRSLNLKSAYVDKIYMREMLGFHLLRDLGEPYCETWFARLYLNGEYLGLYLYVENPGGSFLERNRLAEGALWKAYSTGHAEGQSRGSPVGFPRSRESALARPTAFGGTGGFELKAGDPIAAESALSEFLRGVNRLTGAELEAFIRQHVDIESFTTYLAACQLIHNADHMMKNYLVYASPEGRFTYLGWDLDLTHGRNYECNGGGILNDVIRHDLWDPEFGDDALLYGTLIHPKCDGFWNAAINAVIGRTQAFRSMYYRKIAAGLRHHYHPDILVPRAQRIRELIEREVDLDRRRWGTYGGDGDFDRRFDLFVDWTRRRYTYLRDRLASLGHRVGPPLSADFEPASRSGRAPLRVRFENFSVGKIRNYEWDFGDGEKSTSRSPTHTFRAPGVYDVTLRVTDRAGEHAVTRRDCVAVLE